MYKVTITDPALYDLRSAVFYISNELNNQIAANRLLDEFKKAQETLSFMPNRNPFIQDSQLATLGLRKMLVKNYLLIYRVYEESQSVIIYRILYSRRDWVNILKSDNNL